MGDWGGRCQAAPGRRRRQQVARRRRRRPGRASVPPGWRRDGPGPRDPGRRGRGLRPGGGGDQPRAPRDGGSVRGADDRAQQAHPRPAALRHAALRARAGQGGCKEGRGHDQRRLRGHLRRRTEALSQGARRAARAVADCRAACVGPARGRRGRGQRDHVHPHQALHRHRRPRGSPGRHPRVRTGRQATAAAAPAHRHGQLHAAGHGPVPGAACARAWAATRARCTTW